MKSNFKFILIGMLIAIFVSSCIEHEERYDYLVRNDTDATVVISKSIDNVINDVFGNITLQVRNLENNVFYYGAISNGNGDGSNASVNQQFTDGIVFSYKGKFYVEKSKTGNSCLNLNCYECESVGNKKISWYYYFFYLTEEYILSLTEVEK